jgi:tRNA(Arg) A34 adenosine deaminase TadA
VRAGRFAALDQLRQTQKVHRSQTHVPRGVQRRKFTTRLKTSNAQFREPRERACDFACAVAHCACAGAAIVADFQRALLAANKTLTNQSQPSVSLSYEKKDTASAPSSARTFVPRVFPANRIFNENQRRKI